MGSFLPNQVLYFGYSTAKHAVDIVIFDSVREARKCHKFDRRYSSDCIFLLCMPVFQHPHVDQPIFVHE